MWELDCEESWALKNWRFWTVVLEKTFESPLDCKEIQPVHSEGDQLWDFFGRNDAKAETPVLWPPHAKGWLIGKDSDAGGTGGRRRRGRQRMRWLDGITDSMDVSLVNSGSWWWTGRPGVLRFMGSQRVGHYWVTEPNWTELLHSVVQDQICLLLQVFLGFLLLHSSSIMKRTSFLGVSSRRSCRSS